MKDCSIAVVIRNCHTCRAHIDGMNSQISLSGVVA